MYGSSTVIPAGEVCSKAQKNPQIFTDKTYESTAQNSHFAAAIAAQSQALNAMAKRMEAFAKNGQLATKFYSRNAVERQWLLSAWVRIKVDLGNEGTQESVNRAALLAAFLSADQPAVKTLVTTYEADVASGNADASTLVGKTIASRIGNNVTANAAWMTYSKFEFTQLLPLNQDLALVEPFVVMSDQDWRNRAAINCENNIARLEQDQITGNLTPAGRAELGSLRKQLTEIVGTQDQEARRKVLRRFLNSIPRGSIASNPPISGPAMNDYSIARAEYDALLATIQQKRVALQPVGGETGQIDNSDYKTCRPLV